MNRTIKINFPDDFKFPERFSYENCQEKCFLCAEDDCGIDYCVIARHNDPYDCQCQFYGKSENDVVEIDFSL